MCSLLLRCHFRFRHNRRYCAYSGLSRIKQPHSLWSCSVCPVSAADLAHYRLNYWTSWTLRFQFCHFLALTRFLCIKLEGLLAAKENFKPRHFCLLAAFSYLVLDMNTISNWRGLQEQSFLSFQKPLVLSKSQKLIILAQRSTKESFNHGIPV